MTHQFERFTEGNNRGAVEGRYRALTSGIELAERLDQVTHELGAHRVVVASRKKVDDATPPTELAMRLDRVPRHETRVGEEITEVRGRELASYDHLPSGKQEPTAGRHPRQQGRGRRDHQAGGTLAQRRQRPCPGGGDIEMRNNCAIGIDLKGRKGQHDPSRLGLGHTFERRIEKAGVGAHDLHRGISRHDQESGRRGRYRRHGQRLRGQREAMNDFTFDAQSSARRARRE